MNDATPEPPTGISHPVAYEVFGESARNSDFKGKGTLEIRPDGPTYLFRGKRRTLFTSRPAEISFGPDDIWNVVVVGRQISFRGNWGKAGARKAPFVFFCGNADEARATAELLPTRKDEDFTAARDFHARLNALAGRTSPWGSATNIIIALNVAVFVTMGCLGAGWFDVESMTPYILYGANNGAATTNGEWWRLLSSMFVHYGVIHLLCNMWALYQAGHFVERLLGRWLFLLTYLASGLAGGLVSIGWHGDKVWSAGASGAIFGIYGSILGYLLREQQSLPAAVYQPMLKSTLIFAGYNMVYGLRAGVDNSCHVGGLVGGVVFGWLLALPVDAEVRRQQSAARLRLGAAVLCAFVAAGVMLTPRFDYNLRDEFAWEAALKGVGDKENELVQKNQQALAALEKGADGTAHADWMASTFVPFYEDLDQRITALQLQPGRLTARRRDVLDNFFRLRLAACRRLIDGLRNHNANAVAQYYQDDAKAAAEIERLKKP